MYLSSGLAKVEIALARGKRKYDKRQDIAERTARRDMERALKEREQRRKRR
jgi:SsrA-binding protein